ncbi:SDR family NAD(P)-dependent oxidoreductase [Lentisphaerota bacterium ZTH]|nr:SDR family oxidoreductase [Lentisphaerota bacterium]WET07525.1 SDR family NAD(P)-dependent oxidoreductase [Lentisphaerota bacterium ZTH]
MQNSDKTVLITGGTKGIGLATVKRFCEAGMRVITCGRKQDIWQAISKKHSILKSVDFFAVDLCRDDELERFFAHIRDKYHFIDIAVNNAAMPIAAAGNFKDLDYAAISLNLENDLIMPVKCIKKELDLMRSGSNIVNVTSISGFTATTQAAVYTAAKHGLEGLSKTLALELIGQNIRVNCVAPGLTMTPRWDKRLSLPDSSAELEKIQNQLPAGRFAAPEEIAAAIFWISSEQASYVNGHTLVVDGGFSIPDARTCKYE